MLPYWFLFAFFALGALLSLRAGTALPRARTEDGAPDSVAAPAPSPAGIFFVAGMLLVLVMIGLRYDVGGDWWNYQRMFERTRLMTFAQQIDIRDPGYQSLNWLVAQLGGEVWLVNLVCAALFCWGLYRLAVQQPEPWLVLVVAIPYLVTVVAMGYTRQAAALGILMAGIASVMRGGGLARFALTVAFAALFHRTAVMVLPLLTFAFPRSRATNLLFVVAASVALYFLVMDDSVEHFRRNYIEAQYDSQGAAIRIAQLALAAVIFFWLKDSLGFPPIEERIWKAFAFVGLLTVPALIVSPSSTAVDRASLYLLPLQLAVLARLPLVVSPPVFARMLVIGYSAVVLFVWLNYADNAEGWLPYQTILADEATR